MQEEIDKCLDIYKILEDFQYKFTKDDYDKKWIIFGSPKETLDICDQRRMLLENEKEKFMDEMKVSQELFKDNVEILEKQILAFDQHNMINQHEEIAQIVTKVNKSIEEYQRQSKQFNSREGLFGMDISDYGKINQIAKEFAPYSNLWLTTSNWFKNYETWMNGKWDSLDAISAEKFVEESLRTLAGVSRNFRDKNIDDILNISESIRAKFDKFRPKVIFFINKIIIFKKIILVNLKILHKLM